jgi:DNA repair exonuclease SbcCD ATPase subunit
LTRIIVFMRVGFSLYLIFICQMKQALAFTHRCWVHTYTRQHRIQTPRILYRRHLSAVPDYGKGDRVQVEINGSAIDGTIQDRNGGWYSVQLSDGMQTIVKRRKSQLLTFIDSSEKNHSLETSVTSERENIVLHEISSIQDCFDQTLISPTIIDLDAAISSLDSGSDTVKSNRMKSYINQCKYFSTFQKWVTFTDLHVAPSTLNTCLDVLSTVNTIAKKEKAGVLFLGDFWHHRGTVRVDCLNAVLNALSEWEVPMIMIPGNHDQISLDGVEHGLTPLQNAYRISAGSESMNGVLIFSHPTKFMNALFVPHTRDIGTMQAILQSKVSASSSAVFVHADVTGAQMNDLIVSTHGVAPAYFPPFVPIYSGHFHKPHVVEKPEAAPGVSIRYVGSPYETTLQEAHQNKALLILNSNNNWNCHNEVPLAIGRKHWRARTIDEFLQLPVMSNHTVNDSITGPMSVISAGDRVVVSVNQLELESVRASARTNNFDAKVKELRSVGASVEIREIKPTPTVPESNDGNAASDWLVEDLTPRTTWSTYLNDEVSRNTISNDTATNLLEVGYKILDELSVNSSTINTQRKSASTFLSLDEITLEGFGSFKELTTYPLSKRGLVLLRGSNRDGGSDSNGSGKTTLAMSTLWALTGSIDPRPMEDGKVSDIVHDDVQVCLCLFMYLFFKILFQLTFLKTARVVLRGTINEIPFRISRSKTKSKTALTFVLDGEDLTRQSAKETQMIIDESLGVSSQLLSRAIFHGQHNINGLLESTDSKFKDELSLIVPLTLWQEASTYARKLGRDLSRNVSELDGMISIRSRDLDALKDKLEKAERLILQRESELSIKQIEVKSKIDAINERMDPDDISLNDVQNKMSATTKKINMLEAILNDSTSDLRDELAPIHEEIQSNADLLEKESLALEDYRKQLDRSDMRLKAAKEYFDSLENKWGVDGLLKKDIATLQIPDICPTCKQHTHGNSHANVRIEIENDLNSATESVETLSKIFDRDLSLVTEQEKVTASIDFQLAELRNQADEIERSWRDARFKFEQDLQILRNEYAEYSNSFTDAVSQITFDAEGEQIKVKAQSELQSYLKNLEIATDNKNLIAGEVSDLKLSLTELKNRRDSTKRDADSFSSTAEKFGARGIQTYILKNAVHALQSASQEYLDVLSDRMLKLELELDSGDRILRNVFVLGTDGTWTQRPLASLSGGQWRRCSLALTLGFSDLISRRGRLCSSLLVLDEPLTHLDSAGRDCVGKLLRKIVKQDNSIETEVDFLGNLSVSTILVILQDLVAEELAESFDYVDEVVKSGGYSNLLVDNFMKR